METLSPNVRATGMLDVGDGHSLYYEDWGNPDATPIFHLHGGPGSGGGEQIKLIYNPKKHHVIFHDQRGAGRSSPYACTDANTSQHLIADIERLREHLGIESLYVSGGSWGSTLALLYALAHPERVKKIMVWSLFLGRQSEVDFVNDGRLRSFFPEAWERFIGLVPPEHRGSGQSIMQFYADAIHGEDEARARTYANEWTLWESSLLSINYNKALKEKSVLEDRDNTAVAKIETHYFLNNCFVPENYILDSLSRISHIPCTLIHGRFDMCTPASTAYDLAHAYGDALTLIYVNSGHSSSDPEMNVALRTSTQLFFD
jgi:proline iminopeptidase